MSSQKRQVKSDRSSVSARVLRALVVLLVLCDASSGAGGSERWEHLVDFDPNFRLLWNVDGQEVTFEMQARTLGYVGLGFSKDGTLAGADLVVGWMDDQGHAHLQDRHIRADSDGEPIVDPSQDYRMQFGFVNQTHTVFRFKRNLDTCDMKDDFPITNDTMRVIFMYSDERPQRGSDRLPQPLVAFKGSRSIFLTQRSSQDELTNDGSISVLELRNEDVELPEADESLYWCKIFKLDDFVQKHHLVRYEPVFDSPTSVLYLNHIILYECQGLSKELEQLSRQRGQPCFRLQPMHCNTVVANWARGSDGFTFPPEAGYPLESHQATYYMLETHYNYPDYTYDFSPFYRKNLSKQQRNMNIASHDDAAEPPADDGEELAEDDDGTMMEQQMVDNSGLKLYYTHKLRQYDAGVLSVGLDPNWRHIIPPRQEKVVSEGHCIGACTQRAFPREGINIFAVMSRTHLIGRQVKLRQVRGNAELQPIMHDTNIDPSYQDYRRLAAPAKVLPGDSLVAECIYDSSSRKSITLGGMTTREEICLILTLYYPRQRELTSCHSLPSLPTVLHSLGIEELASGTNPVVIASPAELAGMTLERRLTSYDWENQFESFQDVTRQGSFKPLCWTPTNTMMPGSDAEAYGSNITASWKPVDTCRTVRTNLVTEMIDMPAMDDHESTNMIDVDLKAKMSRSGQQTPPSTNHRQVGRSAASSVLESFLLLSLASILGWTLQ
uniref:DOMON domain-containing protein n=1 Tax=Anopheles atroparvus TaxID=41427 RepID=A0AAG5DFT0_ANOAO